MMSIYFDIPSDLDQYEKTEIYETLLYGFQENSNVSIVKDIETCNYIVLHQSYFNNSWIGYN